MRLRFLIIFSLVCWANVSHAQPGLRELSASPDPCLTLARSHDPAFSLLPSQEDASSAYERYLETHPESELAPFIYYHLGHMFASANGRNKRFGFRVDKKRASQCFQRSMESHPEGKISSLLCRARICFASLGDTAPERLKRYAEYYGWLVSLDRRQVEETLWLPDDVSSAWKKNQINTFMKNRDAALSVAGTNMVSIAVGLDASDVPGAVAVLSNLPTDLPLIENLRKRLAKQAAVIR
jgi:hypothetical protein